MLSFCVQQTLSLWNFHNYVCCSVCSVACTAQLSVQFFCGNWQTWTCTSTHASLFPVICFFYFRVFQATEEVHPSLSLLAGPSEETENSEVSTTDAEEEEGALGLLAFVSGNNSLSALVRNFRSMLFIYLFSCSIICCFTIHCLPIPTESLASRKNINCLYFHQTAISANGRLRRSRFWSEMEMRMRTRIKTQDQAAIALLFPITKRTMSTMRQCESSASITFVTVVNFERCKEKENIPNALRVFSICGTVCWWVEIVFGVGHLLSWIFSIPNTGNWLFSAWPCVQCVLFQ